MSKKVQSTKLLTETELELMSIIWKLGEANVNDVLKELSVDRKLAYTSVSTILRILEQKAILKSKKEGRGHIYYPLISKSDYELKTVNHVVEKVFNGTPIALVKQLLNANKLSKEELHELKQILKAQG